MLIRPTALVFTLAALLAGPARAQTLPQLPAEGPFITEAEPGEHRVQAEYRWQDRYRHPLYLQPGYYELQSYGTSKCLLPDVTPSTSLFPYFKQTRCGSGVMLALIPKFDGTYTIRLRGQGRLAWPLHQTNLETCATVARNVVFGAPRMDHARCETGVDGRAQRFVLTPTATTGTSAAIAAGTFRIQADGNLCAQVLIGQTAPSFVPCASGSEQKFRFIFKGALKEYQAELWTRRDGWTREPGGRLRRLVLAGGSDLPGGDYLSVPTSADKGHACALKCLADTRCRSFTYTPPPRVTTPTKHVDIFRPAVRTQAHDDTAERCGDPRRSDERFVARTRPPCVERPGGPPCPVYVAPANCITQASGSRITPRIAPNALSTAGSNVTGQQLAPLPTPSLPAIPQGRCWLKTGVPTRVYNPDATSAIVRP